MRTVSKILIVDDSYSKNDFLLNLEKYDKKYFIANNQIINRDIDIFEFPEFDYTKIEKLAYDLCEKEMERLLKMSPFDNIKEPFKETIKKNMLQIYGYYYKKAKLIDLINRYKNEDITICSDYVEEGDINGYRIINHYKLPKLKFIYLVSLLKRLISPLLHKNKIKINTDTLVAIDAPVKWRLFQYYFPFIKNFDILLISDKKNPRVHKFTEYCDAHGINYFEYRNSSFLKTFSRAMKAFLKLKLPHNYREYLTLKYYINNLYDFSGFEKLFEEKDIKTFIMSGEYNSLSNLFSYLTKRNGIKFFNFQHGGIYLANHDYQHFIVMGKWIRDYYIKNTNSNKEQFLVLGNPFLSRNKGFNEKKLKKRKLSILFMGQYIIGYVTRDRKEKIVKCINKIARIPGIEITIKDHPVAKDNIIKKYFTKEQVRILGNNDDYIYEDYDLVLSFYSTTLIESVWCGVPSIALNFDKISGILLLEKSKIMQVTSCDELEYYVTKIRDDRSELMKLYNTEIKLVKKYWNSNEKDYVRLKREFYV